MTLVPLRAAALLLAVLTCGPSHAQSAAAQAGAEVLAQRCLSAGGRPRPTAGLVRAIRLGGVEAAVLDAMKLTCEGAQNPACGPFGCTVKLWAGASTPAFEGPALAWRARGERFEVTRAPAFCEGAQACSESYRLNAGALERVGGSDARFERDSAPLALDRRAARPPSRRAAARRTPDKSSKASEAQAVGAPPELSRAAPMPAPTPEARAKRRRTLEAAPYVP
jgi:hypothetical protein